MRAWVISRCCHRLSKLSIPDQAGPACAAGQRHEAKHRLSKHVRTAGCIFTQQVQRPRALTTASGWIELCILCISPSVAGSKTVQLAAGRLLTLLQARSAAWSTINSPWHVLWLMLR